MANLKLLDRLRGARTALFGRSSNATWFNPDALSLVPRHFSAPLARALPAVKLAIRKISWRVASLPLSVYTISPDGTETQVKDEETELVTRRWTTFGTRVDGIQKLLASTLLHGYGAVYVQRRAPNGPATGLLSINPADITRHRRGGETVYEYGAPDGLIPRRPLRQDLIWLSFEPPEDGVTDVSPLREAWQSLRAALAAILWMGGYYDRGATPTVVYSREDGEFSGPDQLLDENEALWENEDLMRKHQRRSMTIPPKWRPWQLGGNASDAAAERAVNMGVQEVARIYDVPPLLLQDLSRATYSNFAQARHGFAEVIELWATRVVDELNNILWPGGTRMLRFDITQAMREPRGMRMLASKTGIDGRVLTPNEARQQEGLPALDQEGADDLQLSTQGTPSNGPLDQFNPPADRAEIVRRALAENGVRR